MIPPIYILITVLFPDIKSRAKYFGIVSGAGGLGAAAGPLIGGVITSAISWRASFGLQVLIVAWVILLARKITDPARTGPTAEVRPDRCDPVGGRPVLHRARAAAVADVRVRAVAGRLQDRRHRGAAQGLAVGGLDRGRDRRAVPGLVLPARAGQGAQGAGRAAVAAPVQEQGLQPRPGHPAHPVADPAGLVLRAVGLPAGSRRLQRDQDRPAAHPGHDRDPASPRPGPTGSPGGIRSAGW